MKSLLVLLPVAFLAVSAAGRPKDLNDPEGRLRGVWKLVSYKSSIKRSVPWVGLMFLDGGYFARIYQEVDRRRLDFNFETGQLTTEQKGQVIDSFKQFRAGIGTYRIAGSTMIMKSTAIYNPSALGNEFSREFVFEGDRLILTGTTKVAGDEVEEVWESV